MKLVLTNVPPDHADVIARALVTEGLVACANILPVRSIYRWKGAVCDEPECTLVLKVPERGIADLRTRLLALHPYELPEFVVLDIDPAASLPAYVAWVESSGVQPH
ncbi:MAG: divalent-cation tolerance protein CutA [Verrucomicrobiota bacterium]|jgi:periplasmic divalent cation tolerance protein